MDKDFEKKLKEPATLEELLHVKQTALNFCRMASNKAEIAMVLGFVGIAFGVGALLWMIL